MCRDSACARCIRSPRTGQGLRAHFPSWFHQLLTLGISLLPMDNSSGRPRVLRFWRDLTPNQSKRLLETKMRFLMLMICLCSGPNAGAANAAPSIDGVWQSDGYGFLLEIQGESARLFSIGDDFCIAETDALVPMGDLLPGVEFQTSSGGQWLTIRSSVEPHRISAHRRLSLPPRCATQTPVDAVAVFDAFVGFFDHSYPFFSLHNVDWPTHVAEARQRVHVTMSDHALFDELSGLIAPIRDGHVALIAEIDGTGHVSSPGRARILQNLRQNALAAGEDPVAATRAFREEFWYKSVQADILDDKGHIVGNDLIQYGMLTEEIGYLALAALDGFGPDEATPEENLRSTRTLLDEVMIYFAARGAHSIVLDLSLNFGGSDYIAREVASRFLHQTTFAYTKFAGDADTPILTRVSIAPSTGVRFEGDVALLTSNVTVSAAEVLTLALRTQHHVSHFGEATRGAFSDALSRSLPNGWQLNMSNEIYLDPEERHWEAVGIRPDVERPVFQVTNPIESHKQAIQLLLQDASWLKGSWH